MKNREQRVLQCAHTHRRYGNGNTGRLCQILILVIIQILSQPLIDTPVRGEYGNQFMRTSALNHLVSGAGYISYN